MTTTDPNEPAADLDDWDDEDFSEVESTSGQTEEHDQAQKTEAVSTSEPAKPEYATAAVGAEGEVVRRRRKSSPESTDKELDWGQKESKSSQNQWWIYGVMGVLVVLAIVVAVVSNIRNVGQSSDEVVADTVPVDFDSSVEVASNESAISSEARNEIEKTVAAKSWFVKNSGTLTKQMADLLTSIGDGSDASELSDSIRNYDQISPKMAQSKGSIFLPLPIADKRDRWQIKVDNADDKGFAILWGAREDGTEFEYYFTVEDDELRLDWEASSGYSGIPVEKVLQQRSERPAVVRAIVRKGYTYIRGYDDENWSCWDIVSPDEHSVMWAYVPKGGKLDVELKSWLNFGEYLSTRKQSVRGIFEIKTGVSGSHEQQFEISKIIQQKWVKP